MIPSSASKLAWVIGAVALAAITVITLAPEQWVVVRTGVHWMLDHFVGYFCLTLLVCSLYRRPFVVAVALTLLAGLLEALQGLTIDRTPDLLSALSGAGGVLTAALLAGVLIRVEKAVPQRPQGFAQLRTVGAKQGR
jgi:VanZ family protein